MHVGGDAGGEDEGPVEADVTVDSILFPVFRGEGS